MYNNPYNYYPYMNGMNTATMGTRNFAPGMATPQFARSTRPSLFQAIKNIKWGTILTNTQKTLNVINQAIPVYYQIKPIVSNLRSFGKIMRAFNSPDTDTNSTVKETNNNTVNTTTNQKEDPNGLPTFFID